MLSRLTIRDIVLIDRLDIEVQPGLTVLTGETGAGKSILLDALALALGGRGDGGLVRHGEARGEVTAVFDMAPGHAAVALARSQDLPVDGELILRRVQFADGRTRAYINDAPVSAQALRALARLLVEIHGQHDERALIDPAMHRSLLDAYGRLGPQAAEVRRCHETRQTLIAALRAAEQAFAAARADADYLAHVAAELDALAPEPGEEEVLAGRRTTMQGAEKIAGELQEAYRSVAGDGGPGSTFAALIRRLERRSAQAPELVEPCTTALDAVLMALDAAEGALATALKAARFDPRELERVEERLFALRAAARKHGCAVDALPALAETFRTRLAMLDADETRLADLICERDTAETAYRAAASALSAARHAAAGTLDTAVNAELPPLKLERARFSTEVATDQAGAGSAEGIDRVEFWVSTNPGSRPGPLTRIASGGELSRFMLALKVSLADQGSAPTLVFDEIDTGVGGAVADAIGRRLARLADGVQVLAVTHAPQVAARSTTHLRIAKGETGAGEALATRVALLDPSHRREEIARMLAGSTVTDEARAAARRLIEAAGP